MTERRFESRFLCADLVKVEWMAGASDVDDGSGGGSRTVEALLEDISPLGACVQVEERIPLGAKVSISVVPEETARLSGRVSYCVYRDYGYFVGLQFSNETRWSSGIFEPRHLTSLEALMEPPNAAHN
jgi:hypothetical protein